MKVEMSTGETNWDKKWQVEHRRDEKRQDEARWN